MSLSQIENAIARQKRNTNEQRAQQRLRAKLLELKQEVIKRELNG